MSNAVQLGPLLLRLVLASFGASFLVGNRVARKAGVDVADLLWRSLFVGVLTARLAFVLEYQRCTSPRR